MNTEQIYNRINEINRELAELPKHSGCWSLDDGEIADAYEINACRAELIDERDYLQKQLEREQAALEMQQEQELT